MESKSETDTETTKKKITNKIKSTYANVGMLVSLNKSYRLISFLGLLFQEVDVPIKSCMVPRTQIGEGWGNTGLKN